MRNKIGLALCALLLVAGAVYAQSVHDVYKTAKSPSNNGAPGFYRTAVDGTDSKTYSTTPIDPQAVSGGDTFLVVTPRHSAGSTTMQVEVGLYFESGGTYSFMTVAGVQTSTSTERTDGTGYFATAPLYFPLNGAKFYDVRVTAASAGTCALKAWSCGAGSMAAE